MSDEGTIYYIGSPETGRVKIGFTKSNPRKRLKCLQTGSPTKLGILAVHPGSMVLEREIHDYLVDARIHGEWFNLLDKLVLDHLAQVYVWEARLAEESGQEAPEWAITGIDAMLQIGLAPPWAREMFA